MAKKSELLTSAEFSKKTGLPTSTVSKLMREGKIKAAKKSGKWMISPDQLKATAVSTVSKNGKPPVKKKTTKPKPKKALAKAKKSAAPTAVEPASAAKSFSIAEFADMTYLTEKGVTEWLKTGRLTGRQDNQGAWRIDSANLDVPNIKRLVREN
jgi:predicted site-specific integrase-resolvase